MAESTADRVLAALQSYKLKRQADGQYRCNCPWKTGSNSKSLVIRIHDGEHGTWYYHAGDGGGSLYDLAKRLGIPLPERAMDIDSKRAYDDGADYAQQHGLTWEDLDAAGWKETRYKGRPALSIPTPSGERYRMLDGEDPPYLSPLKYQASWYRLDVAAAMAAANGGPLVLCNGEISTLAAQHHGIPATAIAGGGERAPDARLLTHLRAAWDGPILIAFDCDFKGRAASELAMTAIGGETRVVDLGGTNGFDLADFCRLYGDDAAGELTRRAATTVQPTPDEPEDWRSRIRSLSTLKNVTFPPRVWFVDQILTTGMTIFGGRAKAKKSWFALGMALDIARGKR